MPTQKGIAPVLVIILIAFAAGIGGYFVYQNSRSKSTALSPDQIACTQDAKLCPDGSSVGRVGPNCEFSPCPSPQSSSSADMSNWKTYTNTNYYFSFKYPNNLSVRNDSTSEFIGFLERKDENQSQKLVVTVNKNPNNLGIQELLEKNKPIPDDRINLRYQSTQITGYDGLLLRYENPCLGICENIETGKFFTKYIKGNSVIISFSVDTRNQAGNTLEDEKWLDQILSTFKFIE